jgi:hypothetical protein
MVLMVVSIVGSVIYSSYNGVLTAMATYDARAYPGALSDTGCDFPQRRLLSSVLRAVGVAAKEVGQPVVNVFWQVEFGQLL